MKKLLTILITMFLFTSLVACSSGGNDEKVTENDPFAGALLTGGKIIVGTSPDYPPFETLNAQGELEGFEVDLMKKVVDIINKNNSTTLEVQFKQMDFNTIISALQASQIDVGMSGFTYSPDRDCIFSVPHNISKQVIVTRADTGIKGKDDLVGKKVAAGDGTTGASALAELLGEENVLYPGDYTVMYQALQAGQLDAVVSDEAVGDNFVTAMGLVKCDEALVDEEMSFIIKTGNTVLADAFNKAIEEFMSTSDFTDLMAKYELQ